MPQRLQQQHPVHVYPMLLSMIIPLHAMAILVDTLSAARITTDFMPAIVAASWYQPKQHLHLQHLLIFSVLRCLSFLYWRLLQAQPKLEPSLVIDKETLEFKQSSARSSSGAAFGRGFDEVLQRIEKRIATVTMIPVGVSLLSAAANR